MSDGRLPRTRPHWVVTTLLLLGLLLAVAVGWVVVRGIGATNDLRQVAAEGAALKTAITDAELTRAGNIATRIADHADSARALTSDPVWRGFEILPWLGANFTAVREVAEVADDVASDALKPVVDVAADIDLSSVGLIDGAIDLAPFADIEPPLRAATASLSNAAARADRIDADATIEPLAEAIHELREAVTEASTVVGALHGASALLPTMLGGDAPRTYVVAMQNNAELRSSGGIVGALALIRADQGAITLVRNASTLGFPVRESSLDLSAPVRALFDEQPGRFIQNTTSVPDFTEAAPLIAEMWQSSFGETVDGVLAVDTVVAAHLLEATGPVTAGALSLDSENVVDVLLSEVYLTIPDQATQDAVFANASAALFGAALTAPPRELIGALAESADENRIRIWSAHPEEQELLGASSLGGALPQDPPDAATVGVLINDITGGKMDYYADADFTLAVGECRGEPITRVTVTWSNGAPADAAALPPLVTGNGWYGVPAGETRTLIAVYGPSGSELAADSRDGSEEPVQSTTMDGRPVVQHTVQLAPGADSTITVDFRGSGAGQALTQLRHTPLIETFEITAEKLVCE